MKSNYPEISNEKILLTDISNCVNPILSLGILIGILWSVWYFFLNREVMDASCERGYKANCFSSFNFYMDFSVLGDKLVHK